jgi:hypothetical protein
MTKKQETPKARHTLRSGECEILRAQVNDAGNVRPATEEELTLLDSAPDLLEALEALLAGCDHHKIYTGSQGDRARAAIAKAVGA